MPQSLSKILLHLIFSTKNREALIPDGIEQELHAYLAAACRARGSQAYRVGGTANHIHVACTLPRTVMVSKLMEEIKKSSSKWIKEKDQRCVGFSWQAGYGAFSLGQSQLDALVRYIDHQKEHHRKLNFQEEYLDFLKKYKIEYDERYIWE